MKLDERIPVAARLFVMARVLGGCRGNDNDPHTFKFTEHTHHWCFECCRCFEHIHVDKDTGSIECD